MLKTTLPKALMLFGMVGCGSVEAPDERPAPEDEPTEETTPIAEPRFLGGSVRDERADAVELDAGEPLHDHVGPAIELSASCPTIYKYGYLLDREPAFGRQTQTNPLAMRFQAPNIAPLDASATAYRVMTATGEVLAPWTPMSADPDGNFTVTLYRDDVPGLATAGVTRVDARFRDTAGVEKLATVCWDMHALAAPLFVQPAAQASMQSHALFPWTLQDDAPLAPVISGQSKAHVAEIRLTQHTADPTTISIDLTPPTASYTKRVVDDFVEVSQRTTLEECGLNMCKPQPPADPADRADAGTLAPVWSVQVVDEVTSAVICTSASLHLTCEIPGRAADASPRTYRIAAAVSSLTSLSPAANATASTLLGKQFIGTVTETYEYCADLIVDELWGYAGCRDSRMYRRVIGLDSAQITFGATSFELKAITTAAPLGERLSTLSTTTFTAPAGTWDAGDEDLPGPK